MTAARLRYRRASQHRSAGAMTDCSRSSGRCRGRRRTGDTRFFADGGFFTPDRKARFVAVSPPAPIAPAPSFPLVLNTGRVRDHWHTMTRTGKSAAAVAASRRTLRRAPPRRRCAPRHRDADLVRVASRHGPDPGPCPLCRRGSAQEPSSCRCTGPISSPPMRASTPRPGDHRSVSGQPASKHVPVAIERFAGGEPTASQCSRRRPETIDAAYWAIARCAEGWRVELAFADAGRDWTPSLDSCFGARLPAELLAYPDDALRRPAPLRLLRRRQARRRSFPRPRTGRGRRATGRSNS